MRLPGLARRMPPEATTASIAAAVLWLAIAAAVVFGLHRERVHALREAEQQTATLAAVLEENTARTFDSVDVALQGLTDLLSRHSFPRHDPVVRALMRERLRYLPTVRALFVIGPDGHIQHDTDFPRTPDVSLADRDYFRQYVENPALGHALSQALQSRSGTGWFIASTRRISGPDGRFAGVAVAAVQLDTVSRLFRKLELASGQVMSLLHRDGTLIARYPSDDASVGRSYGQLPLFAQKMPQRRSGTYVTSGAPLDYERVVSYRALESQPLVVVLSTAKEAALAGWRRTAYGAAAALLAFTLLLGAGLVAFVQRQEQRAAALAHRAAEAEARAVAELNAKFRTFFEQGCFFSCVLALDGTVLEANNAGLEACGYTREDVVGRRLWECGWWSGVEGRMRPVQEGFAQACDGILVRCETGYTLADGRQTLVELVFSPVRAEGGEVLSVAVLGVDITERKHSEEQLRSLAEDLRNADRQKGEFLATLSHELRNVLAPIQNGMAILEKVEAQSGKGSRARDMVQRQLRQMRHLVDDLLDVSRVSSGKIRLEKERVDLRQLLSAAAESAQAFMEAPGHRLETHLPDLPLPVEVDRSRMLQVLTNLLSNAAKYTPPGGRIALRARREGSEAVVEVVDNGMGIPPEALAKVFDMFEQVSGHLSRAQGGLGIGLALVQKLVALHGGHVEASSEGMNRGSTFTVYLPLVPQVASGNDAIGLHDGGTLPA